MFMQLKAEKGILEIQHIISEPGWRESAKKIVGLGDCWMNVFHSVVNFLQILDWSIVSKPWLFYRKQGGVSCRLIFYKHLFPIEYLYMWSNSFLGFLTHGVLPFPYGDGGGL